MALNVKRMRKKASEMTSSGDFLKFDEGETLLYIHPPLPQADQHETTEGFNFVEFGVHYGVGPGNKMVISLDPAANPILEHPAIVAGLKKRKIKLSGTCPMSELLESDELTDDEQQRSKMKTAWLWGVTPVAYRRSKAQDFQELPFKPAILQAGKQICEGILDVICEEGDITDMNSAIFVRVARSGKGLDTEYKVKVDTATLKKPKKLTKEQQTALKKALTVGGDCDLFRVLVGMIKSPAQVQAVIDGMEMDGSEAVSSDDDDDDDGAAVVEEEEEEGGDEEPEDEEGEDEEEEDEEEPEEEETPPPPKASKKKTKKKVAKVAKVKPVKKVADDDEDDDLDDIDAELERLSKKAS